MCTDMSNLSILNTPVTASSCNLLDCSIDTIDRYHHTINLVVGWLYIVLFVPALLLNTMAAWISWNLKTKSACIVYLKNLVAADLLMTLLIPLRGADRLPGSSLALRAFNCQFGSVLFYLCMVVSIILLGVISVDRFFKIVQPGGKLLGQSALFGKVVSAAVWIVPLSTTAIPNIVLTNQKPVNYSSQNNMSAELCMAMKNDLGKQYHKGVIIICNVIYLIVLAVIGFCYACIAKRVIESYRNSRSKNAEGNQKTKARVFIILVVFVVCFTPYHITRFYYVQWQVENKITCHWAYHKAVKDITVWIATTNVCLDPLIYFLLCKAFQKKLHELKTCGCWFSSTARVSNEEDASL